MHCTVEVSQANLAQQEASALPTGEGRWPRIYARWHAASPRVGCAHVL